MQTAEQENDSIPVSTEIQLIIWKINLYKLDQSG